MFTFKNSRTFAAAVIMTLLLCTTCVKCSIDKTTGAGTIDNPFRVNSVAALKKVGTDTNGWTLTAHYKQTANIVFTNEDGNWTPIGDSDTPFSGSYDGNGFTIANLKINAEPNYQGLFGNVDLGGVVKNVGLIDCDITIARDRHYTRFAGGLVGSNHGAVSNSYVTGKVSGDRYLGGLVGANSGTITDCYATCNVSGRENIIGGLVGSNRGTVTNSYASGDVSGRSAVGGLVGSNHSTITNSYASGNVSGWRDSVGGVAGGNSGTVTNSYASGDVAGMDSVGGVVGDNDRGAIENSYATGNVSGRSEVGGVVGRNVNDDNRVSIVTNSYASGNVSGESDVGGVVGRNYGIVENCVALNGVITRTSGTSGRFGRIVGYRYEYYYEDHFYHEHEYNSNVALINNFARSDMAFIDGTIISETFPAAFDGDNGAGITSTDWNSSNWWTNNAKWDASMWDFNSISAAIIIDDNIKTLLAEEKELLDSLKAKIEELSIRITITNAGEWEATLAEIRGGGNGTPGAQKYYTLTIGDDFDVAGSTADSFGSATYITVILNGKGAVGLSSNGNLFSIAANQTLIIDSEDLVLRGRDDNNRPVMIVKDKARLELKNGSISGNARIDFDTTINYGGAVSVHYGNFTMSGGSVSGNTASHGGGVSIDSGSFTMSGGSVSGNTSRYGGGVNVEHHGSFTMSGGSISGNTSRNNGGGMNVITGSFTMSGGSISGNTSRYGGGGVNVGVNSSYEYGSFTMSGGSVSGNTSSSSGGGVNVGNKYSSFTMGGGDISGNTSSSYGGGVNVTGSFTMGGGDISGNTSGNSNGGGVYVTGGGTFTMRNGSISGNTSDSNGGGVYVSGIFTMRGGKIGGNTSAYGGGVFISNDSYFNKAYSGIIYGNETSVPTDDRNTVSLEDTRGHAVYYNASNYWDDTLYEKDALNTNSLLENSESNLEPNDGR